MIRRSRKELALHIEMRTRELVARGIDPAVAREQAIQRLGLSPASNERFRILEEREIVKCASVSGSATFAAI